MAESSTQIRVDFWVKRKVIKEEQTKSGTQYKLIETIEEEETAYQILSKIDEKQSVEFNDVQVAKSNKMRRMTRLMKRLFLVHSQKFNPLSFERLHNTLKLCDIQMKTQGDLLKTLHKLIGEGKVETIDGLYRRTY
eukprot:TRINITY_DN1174_c0_g1_i2.p1 TRINITY_DN1174_c0_g1~~TRINITY_DN1174_c0_g1_i2.p1  ORF type:complete len:136 (+),score=26.36 TRINITY_DN1174_c0_g1_i2:1562-1969(+)